MSAGDIHSILYRGDDPLKAPFHPKFDPTKRISRYWAGKAPDNVEAADEETEESEEESADEEVVANTELQDRRLRRIYEAQDVEQGLDKQKRRRRHLEAVVISSTEPITEITTISEDQRLRKDSAHPDSIVDDDGDDMHIDNDHEGGDMTVSVQRADEDDDAAIDAHRAKLRLDALAKRRAEEEHLTRLESESESEEDESDYESDSSNDNTVNQTLLKPVFISKEKRQIAKEREEREQEEKRLEQEEKQRLLERKRESQMLLVDTVRREEEEARLGQPTADSDAEGMPDDRDNLNEAEEYDLWKIRELKRIKRDREEKETRAKFLAEIARRRNMSEAERREDDKRLDELAPKKDKKARYKFMQKYYHKGAYFQDKAETGEEELYLRDYNQPVQEDLVDKKLLPKVMRLRRGNWGRAGQTKYTHLTDVDTTDFGAAWYQTDKIRIKDLSKMAGSKASHQFERPSAKAAAK